MGYLGSDMVNRFFYTPKSSDVIILDQNTVIQSYPVVIGAPHSYGIFFQYTPARGGLTGIDQTYILV